MSRAVSRESFQGKVRQEVVEQVQQQAKHAALAAIRPLITAFLEAEVDIQLAACQREAGVCLSAVIGPQTRMDRITTFRCAGRRVWCETHSRTGHSVLG